MFPPGYGDIAEERRLAYVAITRGMRRVTITHCAFRRGYSVPSGFLDDLPAADRVQGWLRGRPSPAQASWSPPQHGEERSLAVAGQR